MELEPHKATGLDGLQAKFLIDSAQSIKKPLTHIINMSIISGLFPKELKKSKVIPIHKKNSKVEPGNYRPVSILSIISKIFERVVCEQLTEYLTCNNYLYELQSGFRQSFSTESCLIHLSDFILKKQDMREYVGMIILDLQNWQKAFDTVNHKILINKLKALGLNQIAINWFVSYLRDREQIVDIAGTYSQACNITCGVPQGSILGPLLFLIYVNDMKAAVNCKLILYADDSALLVSGKDVVKIEQALSRELNAVNEWLEENRLSLHLGKTQSILFGSKKSLQKDDKLHITCNGQDIEMKEEVEYLGVVLDQALKCSCIIDKIVSKSINKLTFLYRNTKGFNWQIKRMIVLAMVQCHYDYACAMWFSRISISAKKRLQIVQNKVIRFVLGIPPRTHLGCSEFSRVNILPVKYRADQIKLNHMFNIVHGSAPEYLKHSINLSRSNRYDTRSGNLSCVMPSVKGFGIKSFFYSASKLWNSLSPNLQHVTNKYLFKRNVKAYLWEKLLAVDQDDYIYF